MTEPNEVEEKKKPSAEDLPHDLAALIIWREATGPHPHSFVITKDSWLENQKRVKKEGCFRPETIYTFESNIDSRGRKTVFHFQGVTSWMVNYCSGIVPVRAP